jgi:hypothetical protein
MGSASTLLGPMLKTYLYLSVHRWRWHKDQLFSNARQNLTLSEYYIVLVSILHFQSGRVVKALVEL